MPGAYTRWALLATLLFGAVLLTPVVLPIVLPKTVISAAITGTAEATSTLLRTLRIPCVLVDGDHLHLTNHIFRIDPGCTGITWLVLYLIAVAFMPVATSRRIKGLLIGLPVLVAFNFVRLVSVAAVSQWSPLHFDLIHDFVMQSAFVVVTVSMWAVWMWWSRNEWKPGWDVDDTPA
jgi:exosortase/archaeosortase family protein